MVALKLSCWANKGSSIGVTGANVLIKENVQRDKWAQRLLHKLIDAHGHIRLSLEIDQDTWMNRRTYVNG